MSPMMICFADDLQPRKWGTEEMGIFYHNLTDWTNDGCIERRQQGNGGALAPFARNYASWFPSPYVRHRRKCAEKEALQHTD
eukprot:7211735-Pyramimonas_sp.AAC.1